MLDLDIREIHILRGPNIWANYPVLEAWVSLGNPSDVSSEESGFNERLKSWLPGIIEHRPSESDHGGFFKSLERATYPVHILELVTSELQTLAGHHQGHGKARHTCVEGLYKVIVRFCDESVALASLHSAQKLLHAAYHNTPFNLEAEIEHLRDVVDTHALGPSTKAIVDAAIERRIPWRRLKQRRSLIQLGHGVKQRLIWTAETDRTGAIAEYIAKDKDLTRKTLRQAGVPVPTGRVAFDADDAWDAAQDIGLPVVVKPRDGNHGRGVFLDIHTRQQVNEVFPHAAKYGNGVIVESFIPGVDHRLLVVGNRMIAASCGELAVIVGDGVQSVHELVESQLNSDPRRGDHDTAPWAKIDTIDWDPTVMADLQRQGHDISTVPYEGERVLVSRFANPSIDVTNDVHPSISEHVVVAARTAGLDICGVDVVCCDITRPLEPQGGAIVEINSSPGLHIHLEPAVGKGQPVGAAIIDLLFPNGDDGRIPLVAISGTRGKTATLRLISHLLQSANKFVAVSSSDGLQLGSRRSTSFQGDLIEGAHGVLRHPWAEVALCEVSAKNILSKGIGFDRCQIAVVLNVGTADLGYAYIDSIEDMAKVNRCVVDIVLPGGTAILNADDPHVAEMAEHCQGSIIFFSREPANAGVMAHRSQGGHAVLVRDGGIHLAEGSAERTLCLLEEVPVLLPSPFDYHLENLLASVGTAWAFGLSDTAIRKGLQNFKDQEPAPS